MIRWNKW